MYTENYEVQNWNYYLMLEESVIETFRYVYPCESNYSTYSHKYVELIQLLGAELDLIFKSVAKFPATRRTNMNEYARKILRTYPEITDEAVEIKQYGITKTPFKFWNEDTPAQSLSWWESYNEIKHNRTENFAKANLDVVLDCLAALYILHTFIIKEIQKEMKYLDVLDSKSKLFINENMPYTNDTGLGGHIVDYDN